METEMTLDQGVEALLGALAGGTPQSPAQAKEEPPADPIQLQLQEIMRRQAAAPKADIPALADAQRKAQDAVKEPEKPAEAADEAQYLEWESGDGKVERIALEDAIAAHTERQTLKQQLAELERSKATMPLEVEQAILAAAQARQTLLAEAQQYRQMRMPQPPPEALLDKASPYHDPERYYALLQDYRQQVGNIQAIEKRASEQQRVLAEEQQQLQQAALARGKQQLQQIWPEVFSDTATRQGLAELLQHCGFDPASALDSVTDPRAYRVMRLAMQGLQAERASKTTVAAVRKTPRLVRGAGRTETPRPGQADPAAMDRLRKTGDIEDALKALGL